MNSCETTGDAAACHTITQPMPGSAPQYCLEVGCQTDPPDHANAECQTDTTMFAPEPADDVDIWTSLGSTVAGLPATVRSAVYHRLIRFLEMGSLTLSAQRGLPRRLVDPVCEYCLTFARVPFRICNFCLASPSYHHGRCCPHGPGQVRNQNQGGENAEEFDSISTDIGGHF